MRRARSNLARARSDRGLPEVLFEDLCFDAQQAGEKAIKAVLLHVGVRFQRTHAIVELLTLAHAHGIDVPDDVRQAGILTAYAVETRYPGVSEDVTEEDYERALMLAERVVAWASRITDRPRRR